MTPAPAQGTTDQVADALAQGFAAKDVAVLARVISQRCFFIAVWQAGPVSLPADGFLDSFVTASLVGWSSTCRRVR